MNITSQRYLNRQNLSRFVVEYGLLILLLGLIVVFASLNTRFLIPANFATILSQNAALFIVAVGMTFAIISRNIDLSPGSLIALGGTVLGLVFVQTESIFLGIVACFLAVILVQFFNGLLIARLGINPLIVTLACWIWARGLAISLTRANSIPIRDPFIDFMNRSWFLNITPPVILIVIVAVTGWFLLNRTRLGRYTYAMGSDERATVQAGVPIVRYKLMLFVMFGILAGLGAIITVGRLGAAVPTAAYGLELDAIVAVIIGGNPFLGGDGKLRRTLIGAFFIAVLNNGLSNLGMLDSQIAVYKGLSIIVALLFSSISLKLLK